MISAFQGNAFQTTPVLAFQISTAPPPVSQYYPDETGAGGLNVLDPSVILEYRKRIEEAQKERANENRKADKDEISRLVAKAYNKALGIEEPEDTPAQETAEVLPRVDEAKVARLVREQLNLQGLQASLAQIATQVRIRKAEAIALARRHDIEHRTRLLMAAEAEDDAELDRLMEEAEKAFALAQEMLK